MTEISGPHARVFIACRPYQIVLSHLVLEQEQAARGDQSTAHLICRNLSAAPGDELLIDHDAWTAVHRFATTAGLANVKAYVDAWAGDRPDRRTVVPPRTIHVEVGR